MYNRTKEVTEEFMKKYGNDTIKPTPLPPLSGGLYPYFSLRDLVASLERPRKVMIMVKAGAPVDAVIAELVPLLENGDMIIDCGNSFYQDTIRRSKELVEKGIDFVGCGVSGGEEGALHGPSIMPGCSKTSYTSLSPILESIAALDFQGGKCVSYIGTDGAGHYVKMVHNGIEYAVMQMIAEAYEVFRKVYHLSASEIAAIFETYNQ